MADPASEGIIRRTICHPGGRLEFSRPLQNRSPESTARAKGRHGFLERGAAWLAAGLLLAPAAGVAQAWRPDKPVEIIIGTSPGGPQDRTGRLIQKILQEQKLVSAPVNVVNKPGGGGVVGLNHLSQHPGDGHYLMVNAMTLFTNQITGRTPLAYTDFTPIAVIGVEYVGVAVRADSPVKNGRELTERLQEGPGLAQRLHRHRFRQCNPSFVSRSR